MRTLIIQTGFPYRCFSRIAGILLSFLLVLPVFGQESDSVSPSQADLARDLWDSRIRVFNSWIAAEPSSGATPPPAGTSLHHSSALGPAVNELRSTVPRYPLARVRPPASHLRQLSN